MHCFWILLLLPTKNGVHIDIPGRNAPQERKRETEEENLQKETVAK